MILNYDFKLESVLCIAGKKLGKQKPNGLYFAKTMRQVQNLQNINQGDKLILK
jgi:hypothetical protein